MSCDAGWTKSQLRLPFLGSLRVVLCWAEMVGTLLSPITQSLQRQGYGLRLRWFPEAKANPD